MSRFKYTIPPTPLPSTFLPFFYVISRYYTIGVGKWSLEYSLERVAMDALLREEEGATRRSCPMEESLLVERSAREHPQGLRNSDK